MSSDIEVSVLQMMNMGWKHHSRLLYLYLTLFVKDIFLISVCNAEFCNNLKVV
jgi:hypothetical protein